MQEEGKDLISDLPDTLLHLILGFLPTKYAVGTSLLSRRWKNLWTFSPNLYFDDKMLHSPKGDNSGELLKKISFVHFINKVLISCNATHIQTLVIICDNLYEISHINAWIRIAGLRKVREIDLAIDLDESFDIPPCLFDCDSLMKLKLNMCVVLKTPTSICFPFLKVLHLSCVAFIDDHSVKQLFSSCPTLEDLVLRCCNCRRLNILNISSPTLKTLKIEDCSLGEYKDLFGDKMVEIFAPKLLTLILLKVLAKTYSLYDLPVLSCAYVDIDLESNYEEEVPYEEEVAYEELPSHKLLSSVSNVNVLAISLRTLESIYFSGRADTCPTFYNLKHLELCSPLEIFSIMPLQQLLGCSPNLQSLVLAEGLDFNLEEEVSSEPLEQLRVFQCFPLHLMAFEMREFNGNALELKLVEYILEHSKVLETMTIVSTGTLMVDFNRQLEISKKLLMLPKGSTAIIVFS